MSENIKLVIIFGSGFINVKNHPWLLALGISVGLHSNEDPGKAPHPEGPKLPKLIAFETEQRGGVRENFLLRADLSQINTELLPAADVLPLIFLSWKFEVESETLR